MFRSAFSLSLLLRWKSFIFVENRLALNLTTCFDIVVLSSFSPLPPPLLIVVFITGFSSYSSSAPPISGSTLSDYNRFDEVRRRVLFRSRSRALLRHFFGGDFNPDDNRAFPPNFVPGKTTRRRVARALRILRRKDCFRRTASRVFKGTRCDCILQKALGESSPGL